MTRDDIIRMAREVGNVGGDHGVFFFYPDELERFAMLVAEAERQACAELVSSYLTSMSIDVGVALALRKNK